MLTNCPECQHRVSSRAESCPACGHPLQAVNTRLGHPQRVQTIQKTAKGYKLGLLIGFMIWASGCYSAFSGDSQSGEPAVMLCVSALGLFIMFVFKVISWWDHG